MGLVSDQQRHHLNPVHFQHPSLTTNRDPPHTMSLQFITSNTIGPKERRLIRSHVMAGKNAGKSRPSHKKQRDNMSKQISTSEIRRQFNDPYAQNYTQSCSRPRIANRLICNDLAFTQLTQQSAETIERLRQCKIAGYYLATHSLRNR
jgi:hypothetical protein